MTRRALHRAAALAALAALAAVPAVARADGAGSGRAARAAAAKAPAGGGAGGAVGTAALVAAAAPPRVTAERGGLARYDRRWPGVPAGPRLTLSQQITDQLTLLGNTLGAHLDALSNEMLTLRFDGRRRRAHVRLGGETEGGYLSFCLAGDIHFTEGLARVATRVDLSIAGRALHLELPEVDVTPTELHGERGVVVRLPLVRGEF